MGAHQTMIWYLVTIRDALALITRAGTYNARANTHSPGAHINPDSSYRYLSSSSATTSSSSTNVYPPIIGPTYIYVFRMNTLFPPVESARRPVASSEYTLLNSNSNIELDYNGCLPASFRALIKKQKGEKNPGDRMIWC